MTKVAARAWPSTQSSRRAPRSCSQQKPPLMQITLRASCCRFALPLLPVAETAGTTDGAAAGTGAAAWAAFVVDETAEPIQVKPEDLLQVVAAGCGGGGVHCARARVPSLSVRCCLAGVIDG